MEVRMIAQGFSFTPSLHEYLNKRLQFSLSPIRRRISDVAVRVRDLNGPRGGRDMMCQVSIAIPGGPAVVVKEVQENMYTAIDLAVKRAAYRVTQILSKHKNALRRATRHGRQATVQDAGADAALATAAVSQPEASSGTLP